MPSCGDIHLVTGTDPGTNRRVHHPHLRSPVCAASELCRAAPLYNSGKLAVIANVGPLVAPLTRAQWYGPSATRPPLPVNLYSHDDQQKAG